MLFVTKPDIFCIPCKLRVGKFPKNSMNVNYMHPEILVLDPEPKDMYRGHPYHFMEICKPPVNEPIGSYQIHHLNYKLLNFLPSSGWFVSISFQSQWCASGFASQCQPHIAWSVKWHSIPSGSQFSVILQYSTWANSSSTPSCKAESDEARQEPF